jgi:RHS repeat-associated protein
MALLGAILLTLTLLQCSHATDSNHAEPAAQHEDDDDAEDGVVWINELTSADTILMPDLTGSSLGEADGLGVRKTDVSLYPYGFARRDNSAETNVFADSPRDRSVGLDHMGSRFYSPQLGIWTSADPAILTNPEQYVTAEFAAANPYAYANLRPVVAADRDGQFWHIAAGAVAGGLIGGGIEAARQYLEHGKIESWGRLGAATAGGVAAGTLSAANPGAGLAMVMGMGATSNMVGGITTRLVASGGKSAGTLTDVATDALVGAGSGGIVKGGSAALRKVIPKNAPTPPASKAPVANVGTSTKAPLRETANGTLTATEHKQLQHLADRFETDIHVVGSRAAGKGRNIDTSLPVSKGPGTRSDIDVIIDGQADIDSGGALSNSIRGVGNGAGKSYSSRGFSEPPHIIFSPGKK